MRFITAKQMKDEFSICSQTLHNWRKSGKIIYKEINSRNFLYDVDSIFGENSSKPKKHVIYARVSNTKQKDDLQRQKQILSEFVAAKGIILDDTFEDIASGMNENRKGFNKLLKAVTDGEIDTIYISYKDRLTRFGFGYLEKWFDIYDTKIVCINFTKEEDFQTELTEDLISIIHHFSMKMYSNRRKMLKLTQQNLEQYK